MNNQKVRINKAAEYFSKQYRRVSGNVANTIDKNGTVTGTISSFDELDDYDYVEDLCYDAMYLMKSAEAVSSTLSDIMDEVYDLVDDDYDEDDDW